MSGVNASLSDTHKTRVMTLTQPLKKWAASLFAFFSTFCIPLVACLVLDDDVCCVCEVPHARIIAKDSGVPPGDKKLTSVEGRGKDLSGANHVRVDTHERVIGIDCHAFPTRHRCRGRSQGGRGRIGILMVELACYPVSAG